MIAVTEQESTFQASPAVPGLPAIARREIDARATRYKIPKFLVDTALGVESPNGKTYRERLEKVQTEEELSDIFADFIGMVPLGERLFGSLNPVHTGGPMQVSIEYAEEHACEALSVSDVGQRARRGVHSARRHVFRHRASARLSGELHRIRCFVSPISTPVTTPAATPRFKMP